MWKEFKAFIMQGNVLDMAIGVVMGAAFTNIVTALVDNIIMPIVTAVTGNTDVSDLALSIGNTQLTYGAFLQAIIDFLLIALVLFLMIRTLNNLSSHIGKKTEEEEEETEETAEDYLAEIRDLLQAQQTDADKHEHTDKLNQ